MADYCSSGIWDKCGANCHEDELPVTDEIKKRLDAWQAKFDKHDTFTTPTEEWENEHMNECLAIATEIKKQLSDWAVLFYNGGHFPQLLEDNHGNVEV